MRFFHRSATLNGFGVAFFFSESQFTKILRFVFHDLEEGGSYPDPRTRQKARAGED